MNLEIWECYQVILLMSIRDSVVGSFLVNPFLCQVQIPLKSYYHQLYVNGRQEKQKENLFIPKKALLWCPRKKNQQQMTRQWHDYCVSSFWLNGNGCVAFHIWGSKLWYHFRPLVSALCGMVFIFTEAPAHCKSSPQASSSQRWYRNGNGPKRLSDKISIWTINPGYCVMSLTFPPSSETTWWSADVTPGAGGRKA